MLAVQTDNSTSLSIEEMLLEWEKCHASVGYFIDTYCYIYDSVSKGWIRFRLWPIQLLVLKIASVVQKLIALKPRQVGITWLFLGYALHKMLFHPIATVLLFSKRDDEAVYLLSGERMRGMYSRLPSWMKARAVEVDDKHVFALSNGSVARAFPTTGGDGYTATLALIDEADLQEDLPRLMGAVKPTIDAGGQLFMFSRVDKSKPNSLFKQIYRAAKKKANDWTSLFLGWFVHPDRTQEWYEKECRDAVANTGSLDTIYEQYPATDAEALAPNSKDKRISADWLLDCYVEDYPTISEDDLKAAHAPAIPQLEVYELPVPGLTYRIGADPAEGNPNSDDSALSVTETLTGRQVAVLAGKFEPEVFADHIDSVGMFFNRAKALVERNNHGHTVILCMQRSRKLELLLGIDDKVGWLETPKSKTMLYNDVTPTIRDQKPPIYSWDTYTQLCSIEGATLKAPEGEHDDYAIAHVLSLKAASLSTTPTRPTAIVSVAKRQTGNPAKEDKNVENISRIGRMFGTKTNKSNKRGRR